MKSKHSSIIDLRSPPVAKDKNIPGGDWTIKFEPSHQLSTDLVDLYELDLDQLEPKVAQISFVPASAKRYYQRQVNHYLYTRQFRQAILNVFWQAKSISYSSAIVFLGLAFLSVWSIPSLRVMNQGLRIKDNLILQASASSRLLQKSEPQDLQALAESLTYIAQGLESSSADINSLQANFSQVTQFLPLLSLIQNGSDITSNSAEVVTLLAELSQALAPFINQEINPFDTSKSITLVEGITRIQDINRRLIPVLEKLEGNLSELPLRLVPGSQAKILRQVRTDLPKLIGALKSSDQYADLFLNFVGNQRLRRYVFIFQNNQELRATGGFIGSFGLMTLDKGVVENLNIQEIYNPDGQLLRQIVAPEPLQQLTNRWFLRDSNWFADFPTSAETIISFYEKTGGVTPDGVISLTPTVIERLLRITGPIEMPEYGVTITADNFVRVTQYQTSVAYDRVENKPKQFIADLAPKLINNLLSANMSEYPAIIQTLNTSFQEKHVLTYFLDERLQELAMNYNLAGALYQTPKDYLAVVHSNIGGFKTDGVMEDTVALTTTIEQSGIIKNRVEVSRLHKGGQTEYEWWNKQNINYMRLYLPKGSSILKVEGFRPKEKLVEQESLASFDQDRRLKGIKDSLSHNSDWDADIFEETSKAVVGGWVTTKPQETSKVVIEYQLPFRLSSQDIYSLIWQKQSGSIGIRYSYNLVIPDKFDIIWEQFSFPAIKTHQGYAVADEVLRTDEYFAMQIK